MRPLLMLLLVILAGCSGSPSAPSTPLDNQFTLAPGETASVSDTSLRVTFLRVSGDSRCPADAICIQGGDAVVHIRARTSSSAEYELHTGDSARTTASHGDFRISLRDVQPYPFSSRPIQAGDYRVTLLVTR